MMVELKSDKGVDYCRLRDFLAAEEWKKADRETERVILQVAERKKGTWLLIKDIEQFPCTDLRTLDELWIAYTDGHFGLSVQKHIYQSLGGTWEYNKKIWLAYCDRILWRKNGMWIYPKDLRFTSSAPSGHLPSLLHPKNIEYYMIGGELNIEEWGSDESKWSRSIFSRIGACLL